MSSKIRRSSGVFAPLRALLQFLSTLPRAGDTGILNPRVTGEGAFCPLPVCPSPRGDTSHGPGYGEGLKNELARGFILPDTALPGYHHDCPRPPGGGGGQRPGGVGDAGILKPGRREGEASQSQVTTLISCDCWRSISSKSLKIR
jgi:hypothetical protein